MRVLATLVLACCAAAAHADEFHRLVGFTCDTTRNRLTVHYRAASNEKGRAMVEAKRRNEWVPGMLIASMRDDDHIGSLTTIRRTCRLKGGVYDIRIGPTPGNFNIQGRCGAVVTAWVEIRNGRKRILPRHELEGDCHDDAAPVTTQITVVPHTGSPVIKTVTPEEWMKE